MNPSTDSATAKWRLGAVVVEDRGPRRARPRPHRQAEEIYNIEKNNTPALDLAAFHFAGMSVSQVGWDSLRVYTGCTDNSLINAVHPSDHLESLVFLRILTEIGVVFTPRSVEF
eukprot:COSAG02_NODE_955_length_15680_cov_31.906681_7_plen_114_part_00